VPGYGGGVVYVAPGYGWIAPAFPLYPDDSGSDDSAAGPSQPGQPAEGYDAEPPYPAPPEPPGIYPPAGTDSDSAPMPFSADGVMLVFKDGRPPLRVHDYVLTHKTLYVWDRRQLVIPTDQLDLVATNKANQDTGVDFQLP